jgi:hypothetical protein
MYILQITNCTLHNMNFFLSQQTQEIQLPGEHSDSFDEVSVLDKSKQEIVVAVFAGFAIGSCKG